MRLSWKEGLCVEEVLTLREQVLDHTVLSHAVD